MKSQFIKTRTPTKTNISWLMWKYLFLLKSRSLGLNQGDVPYPQGIQSSSELSTYRASLGLDGNCNYNYAVSELLFQEI